MDREEGPHFGLMEKDFCFHRLRVMGQLCRLDMYQLKAHRNTDFEIFTKLIMHTGPWFLSWDCQDVGHVFCMA